MKKLLFTFSILTISIFTSCMDSPLTFSEQLEADIKEIDSYLDANDIVAENHPSGLRYVIHQEGMGAVADLNSNITVGYEGRFLSNNQVFDSNESIQFRLGGLIEAWQVALPLIEEGGSMTIYAPSGLCYGAFSRPGIPANSNMIFDLNLIDVE